MERKSEYTLFHGTFSSVFFLNHSSKHLLKFLKSLLTDFTKILFCWYKSEIIIKHSLNSYANRFVMLLQAISNSTNG